MAEPGFVPENSGSREHKLSYGSVSPWVPRRPIPQGPVIAGDEPEEALSETLGLVFCLAPLAPHFLLANDQM